MSAGIDTLAKGFRDARASTHCRGFAVGRTVFQEPSAQWLAGVIGDEALKAAIRTNFQALMNASCVASWASDGSPRMV